MGQWIVILVCLRHSIHTKLVLAPGISIDICLSQVVFEPAIFCSNSLIILRHTVHPQVSSKVISNWVFDNFWRGINYVRLQTVSLNIIDIIHKLFAHAILI